PSLLEVCDVVAFPSRVEPFGNVVIEAWAAARPLVVADAVGPAATVTHEKDALLVPRNDPEALRNALRRGIDGRAMGRRRVNAGVEAYQADFSKAAFVKASLELYDRIIASGRGDADVERRASMPH